MNRTLPLLAAFTVAVATLTGCGPKLVTVTGTVTMDGKPVDGASVTFISEDGALTANGKTDASGNFTLNSTKGPGAYPASYKVVVAKYKAVDVNMSDPGMSKEYMDQVKKNMEASKKNAAGPLPPGAKPGAGGMAPPMMGPGGGNLTSSAKSELPEQYASAEKTPLKATVPSDGPIKLELKDDAPATKKK